MAADLSFLIEAKLHGVTPAAPVSVGELLDKIVILGIKLERMVAPDKLENVRREYQDLSALRRRLPIDEAKLRPMVDGLRDVNARLWSIEDELRACEAEGEFGARFVELARSVYRENDRRAALKSRINEISGSRLREEKSYAGFHGEPESVPRS